MVLRTKRQVAFITCVVILVIKFTVVLSDRRVIAQGECTSNIPWPMRLFRPTVRCRIPSATPGVKLDINLVRQESSVVCVKGQNYGLARDNSFMWTRRGCGGYFEVTEVTDGGNSAGDGRKEGNNKSNNSGSRRNNTSSGQGGATNERSTLTNHRHCGRRAASSFRILGGSKAEDCQFPWMVVVYNQYDSTMCGGSIIDKTHILTAAHCIYSNGSNGEVYLPKTNRFFVISGTSHMFSEQRIINPMAARNYVSALHPHPDFDANTLANDIAIITLTEPIEYDNCHVPVCLPTERTSVRSAGECVTTGWGRTGNQGDSTGDLLWTDLTILDFWRCFGTYFRNDKTFCAGGDGKGTCKGDSGGPVLCRTSENDAYFQYGITSAGIRDRCGTRPGLYTDISQHTDWIQEILSK